MARGTILFADNDAHFLVARSEFLENDGYTVLKAFSPEEARQVLDQRHVQLAILDIRLKDDHSEGDISGLELAQEPDYRAVPKIILTGFPDVETVRIALRKQHALDELPPAVDYLPKKDGAKALIQVVERAFADYVRVNWDIQIQWDPRERLSFLYLADLLQPDLPNDTLVQRAGEVEDLFRKLFYSHQQIRIGRLLWHDGGRVCLPVLAQTSEGATDPRLVVCGERGHLKQEIKRMEEFAPDSIMRATLIDTVETVHFGMVTYVLPDSEIETVQTLRELFDGGRERLLKTVFTNLLNEVIWSWHRHGQRIEETHDLMSLYRRWVGLDKNGLSRSSVESRVEALLQAVRPISAVEVERDNGLITFFFPREPPLICPDPVLAVFSPLEGYRSPVACRISPGRLTADNVLVDEAKQAWLTDFVCAGQAPQWWDYLCLEAIIRFDLSHAPDLLAWLDFEECLVGPSRLDERLRVQDVIADLRTSLVLIEQIRRKAGSEVGPDTLPYHAGLLAWVVGAMARHDPETLYTHEERMRAAHLLLSAARLAWRMSEKFSPSQPGGTLRFESDGSVWVGDRRIQDLMGQELALLRCLYERPGQAVSRQLIVQVVFEEEYDASDKQQESRVNSLVRRLRVRIEPNPDRARYVLTEKGRGYRLEVEGKSQD